MKDVEIIRGAIKLSKSDIKSSWVGFLFFFSFIFLTTATIEAFKYLNVIKFNIDLSMTVEVFSIAYSAMFFTLVFNSLILGISLVVATIKNQKNVLNKEVG